ncbi:GAF and ANTAR domain-containing protein [Mycolicibacterium sp. Dal123E01]|uniref:GAF and ANTAR domain-containing protein n=1 Tax=Mycolicibacterium sp. Dal123E01 TaxID=3457578 RepID=UPI00403E62AE
MSSAHLSDAELAALAESMRSLRSGDQPDVELSLAELTDAALKAMPGADYAGITIAERSGAVTSASATHSYVSVLDDLQHEHREGPCLSAAWQQSVIHVRDLGADFRWPRYRLGAITQTPVRSLLCFQMFADHKTMGALNFYADQPQAFDDGAVEIGVIYATHAALAWRLLRRDQEFRSALASRDIIGQAKGMVMERFQIDAVQAFELLKKLSQNSNTPLVQVARQLVDAERRRP